MKLLLLAAMLIASIFPGSSCAGDPIVGAWAAYRGDSVVIGQPYCGYSVWEVWPDGVAQHFDERGYECYRWERTDIKREGRDLYLFIQVCGAPDNPIPGTSSLYYYDESANMLVCADTGERFY